VAEVTADQVVEAAKGLGDQFTRADLAGSLKVETSDLKAGVKEARESGRLEKVRDDDQGRGVFKLTGS
jgi:hypothetical protein